MKTINKHVLDDMKKNYDKQYLSNLEYLGLRYLIKDSYGIELFNWVRSDYGYEILTEIWFDCYYESIDMIEVIGDSLIFRIADTDLYIIDDEVIV
jgi:hypothetical protein